MVGSGLRLSPSAGGVSIWSNDIFGGTSDTRVREFLSRAFAVPEVVGVELQRASSFGRVNFGQVEDPPEIWRRLSRAVSSPESSEPRVETEALFLDVPSARRIHVSRIGRALSTWRVRHRSADKLVVSHPILRNNRDLVFRLEEELATLAGIEDFRASVITAGASIRFDPSALSAEHLARALEKAWPRLLDGREKPLPQARFFYSLALVGLSFTGQYLVPPLRPLGVAGVAINAIPNVVKAAKELRRGKVGWAAMKTTSLAITVASGRPFAASAIGALRQLWAQLARRKFVRTRRRLISRAHRRAAWARVIAADGSQVEVHVDELRAGDRIAVRRRETVPVAATVEAGSAIVVNGAIFGSHPIEDRFEGDAIAAGAYVRDGELTLRVERNAAPLSVSELLPSSALESLPSFLEAERIADRNAKPALAAAAASFAATRMLSPSQALIRPDYATGPCLSAQLSALHGIAAGLHRGSLFRNPAALDRLASADVYIFDDSCDLTRKSLEVADVQLVDGTSHDALVSYALGAELPRADYARALTAYAAKRNFAPAKAENVRREAGIVHFRDIHGHAIGVATPSYVATTKHRLARAQGDALYVLCDDQLLGVVSFARGAERVAKSVVAAIRGKKTSIVYLSQRPQAEAKALASELGIESAYGGLSATGKLDHVRGLGSRVAWIGDGSDPTNRDVIAASAVSISVAALSNTRPDRADILLPQRGLEGLSDTFELARAHKARLERDYRTVYAVNLLSLGGVFSPNFKGLFAGLLSNAGTGLIYAQHSWSLSRLARAVEADRKRARRSTAD